MVSSDLKCSQQVFMLITRDTAKSFGHDKKRDNKQRTQDNVDIRLVGPHVEYCSSAWSPLYKNRVDRKGSA